ncbi:MetQ/NlpA family ABC transporter substrate-binding protein [Aquibacillus saliphilus]|uniref:MetQ/NlpA family ABC transporter substrate-binding protein n=1 Tax=Aquibacillus saliphilus TaxID=1909422 RepID=UPI001CEFCDCC|nr:MetQ/NlpA family ABC transporter substrate-binding protein [Aquibacillus saliphilus]
MKKILGLLSAVLLLTIITACGGDEETQALSEDKLKIGVTAGPHEEIMEKVKEVAAEDGLEIEIEVISDYITPNTALAEGDLDVNSYQHKPFLDQMVSDRELDLVDVAPTVNFPMGFYSEQITEVSELQEGDKVGLPNDPTNGARALILFEQAGLITLKEDVGANASIKDIEENKVGVEFIELEAAQIPRQLGELTAAAINTNYAMEAGYVPTEDAIVIEPGDSPWVNLIVVRSENKDDPVVDTLINAYHSDEVKQFVEDNFGGSVVTSW